MTYLSLNPHFLFNPLQTNDHFHIFRDIMWQYMLILPTIFSADLN